MTIKPIFKFPCGCIADHGTVTLCFVHQNSDNAREAMLYLASQQMPPQERLLILFGKTYEWEWFTGTIDDAIAEVKGNKRWCDYGRSGAIVVRPQIVYEINTETVERRYGSSGGTE